MEKNIYGNLVKAIKDSNKTQGEIAKALNISMQAFSYKINGKKEFKANEMFVIRDKFFPEMSVDELFAR